MRAPMCALALSLLLLASTVDARNLQQKNKPVSCHGPPPPVDFNTWPADCKDSSLGFACKGTCALGYTGSPTAVCKTMKGGWSANGGCKPAKCDGPLPTVANATWASCVDSPVGFVCTATCDGYFVESGPINSTCTGEEKGASWSPTTQYCGVVNTQALLTIEAIAQGGCTENGTNAVKSSIESFMGAQEGVNELAVSVTCYDGTSGGSPGRRLLQETIVRYVVLVIYIGGEEAGVTLVDTATTNLALVGDLINNVATATGGGVTIQQEGTSGDVSGGSGNPQNPQQDARVSLLRSGADKLQTSTSFFLTAIYNGPSGTAQEGVTITGPTIDPATAATCSPIAPAPLTDALGIATYNCTTGASGGSATLSVEAPNPVQNNTVSASVNITIGTDCVGDFGLWGACSAFCGEGTRARFFTITQEALNGGRPCAFATGDNQTEACPGGNTCAECSECAADGSQCTDLAAGTTCPTTANGKCYNGACQSNTRLFEVSSVSPAGTVPTSNSQWFWGRLYNVPSAEGSFVSLATQNGLTTPAAITANIVDTAPADPRTPGTPISTAIRLINTASTDRAEAVVWFRNNTPDHPPGLFNGMKFKDMINDNFKLTMSWYRGNWASMAVGSAPIFRFTILNPALLPAAAGGGSASRIELIWEPAYDYSNIVPTNSWRTEEVTFSKGKLSVYMGGYATPLYGANAIYAYQPISFWMDPAARVSTKQHPWFQYGTLLYGTDDIFRDGIIWEMRVSALNPKSMVYANNVELSTTNNKFTYVFTTPSA